MDKKTELAIDLGQVIYTNTINSLTQQRDELRRQLAEKDAEILKLNQMYPATAYTVEVEKQLAASQAREVQLLELLPKRTPGGFVSFGKNYAEAEDEFNDPRNPMCKFKRIYLDTCDKNIALPTDTSALEALIAKAGEVMRERCADTCETSLCDCCYSEESQATGQELAGNIRALPGVTLEDLK